MKFRVLIVDDELPSRKLLTRLLGEHQDFEIVGEAGSTAEALTLIPLTRPDLLLLDIQMPRADGFQLIQSLANPPEVVFITAHETHAVQAFDAAALDYLLKPVTASRLAAALARFRRLALLRPTGRANEEAIVLQSHGAVTSVLPADISYLKAAGNYTTFHLADGQKTTIYGTLAEWETKLSRRRFQRVDRSHLIHLSHISQVLPDGRNACMVVFRRTSPPLRLGRTAAKRIRELIRALSLSGNE